MSLSLIKAMQSIGIAKSGFMWLFSNNQTFLLPFFESLMSENWNCSATLHLLLLSG